MLLKHCPKIDELLTPKISVKKCPYCGEEVEFFDFELEVRCPRCGRIVRRDPSEVPFAPCPRAFECITLLEQMGYISHERARELKESIKKFLEELNKKQSKHQSTKQ